MKIDGKWVPREPTAEMLEAAMNAHLEADAIVATTSEVWTAMVAAAPSPGIETLVEGVAWSLLGSLKEMSFKGAGDHWHSEMQYAARAVLRHLFGDEK